MKQASHTITVPTHGPGLYEFTDALQKFARGAEIEDGLLTCFIRHTSASLLVQENADPDVPRDILEALERAVPLRANYRHTEGNSAAHVKSSLVGASELVIIEKGRLVLGTWQSIFFCEFDGPRTRKVLISIIAS